MILNASGDSRLCGTMSQGNKSARNQQRNEGRGQKTSIVTRRRFLQIGAVAGALLSGCAGSESTQESNPTSTPTSISTPTSTSTPIQTLKKEDIIPLIEPLISDKINRFGNIIDKWRKVKGTKGESGYAVLIEYNLNKPNEIPFFTTEKGVSEDYTKTIAFAASQGLYNSDHTIDSVTSNAWYEVGTDKYGNIQYEQISHIKIEKSVASKIQWENFADEDIDERMPNLASEYDFQWPKEE